MTMAIRCRNRETWPNTHSHNTVHEVKVCQGVIKPVIEKPQAKLSDWTTAQLRDALAGMSDTPLLLKRYWGGTVEEIKAEIQRREQAPKLATVPARPAPLRVDPALEAAVPAGRYALPRHDDRDGYRFFRVEKPTEGTWAGRTFVKRQAGDDWYPVRDVNTRASILREIGKDVRGALELYGHELGHCGVCGRTLTNDESRALGIGPVCLAKLGAA